MIDPNNVTNFNRSNDDLLEFWLFCLFVRGKNADTQAKKLAKFIRLLGGKRGLYNRVNEFGFPAIDAALREVGAGQYNTLSHAVNTTFVHIACGSDMLRTYTPKQFEGIRGVGPKTARYFILHTRAKSRVAALDTHILRFLGDRSGKQMPKNTPPAGRRYDALEKDFLFYADFYGVDPAGFDLAIWQASRESYPMDWHRYYEGVKK